jgi:hypothetical protein
MSGDRQLPPELVQSVSHLSQGIPEACHVAPFAINILAKRQVPRKTTSAPLRYNSARTRFL